MCKHGELELMPELGPHGRYIDKCMVDVVRGLRRQGIETLGCCCGHGVYPRTIVIEYVDSGLTIEYYSMKSLTDQQGKSRTRNFYKMDKNGLYFIPEISQEIE